MRDWHHAWVALLLLAGAFQRLRFPAQPEFLSADRQPMAERTEPGAAGMPSGGAYCCHRLPPTHLPAPPLISSGGDCRWRLTAKVRSAAQLQWFPDGRPAFH